MNVLGEIIEKMLTYAIIIGLTRLVLRKTYLSDSFINENTQNVIEIDKKLYAKIFFVIAIIWSILLIIIGSLPSNVSGSEKHLIAGIVIGLNCCGYVLAFYYYFDIVRIDKDGIYVRRGFLRKKRYHFDEIKSYQINQSNRLVINLVNGKNFKLLSSEDDKILQQDVIDKMIDYGIMRKKENQKAEYSIKASIFNIGFMIFCVVISIVLLVVSIIPQYLPGIILWVVVLLVCLKSVLELFVNRITIKENSITVVRLLKKTMYLSYSDIKSKKIQKKDKAIYIHVYGYEKELFKYEQNDRNVERFEAFLSRVPEKN